MLESRASGTISLRMAPDRPFTIRAHHDVAFPEAPTGADRANAFVYRREDKREQGTQTSPTTRSLETRRRCSRSFTEFSFRVAPSMENVIIASTEAGTEGRKDPSGSLFPGILRRSKGTESWNFVGEKSPVNGKARGSDKPGPSSAGY